MGREQARATLHGDVVGKKGSDRVHADSQKLAWRSFSSTSSPPSPTPREFGPHLPGRRMDFDFSWLFMGFWMEQITLPTALSVTKRDASTWKSPSLSWVCDSEEDSRVSPTVSLHCTLGFGNQPLEEHNTRIPLFSGPVM